MLHRHGPRAVLSLEQKSVHMKNKNVHPPPPALLYHNLNTPLSRSSIGLLELAGAWINGHAHSPISGFCSWHLVT